MNADPAGYAVPLVRLPLQSFFYVLHRFSSSADQSAANDIRVGFDHDRYQAGVAFDSHRQILPGAVDDDMEPVFHPGIDLFPDTIIKAMAYPMEGKQAFFAAKPEFF